MAVVKAAVKLTVACSVGLCSSLHAGNTLELSTGLAVPLHKRWYPGSFQDLLCRGLFSPVIKARKSLSVQVRKAGLTLCFRD